MKPRPSTFAWSLVVVASAVMGPLGGAASAQDAVGASSPALAPTDAVAASPSSLQPAAAIDIASLTKDSDFTIFMRPGVPEEVRIMALRKLWTTDPIYNQVSPHE